MKMIAVLVLRELNTYQNLYEKRWKTYGLVKRYYNWGKTALAWIVL